MVESDASTKTGAKMKPIFYRWVSNLNLQFAKEMGIDKVLVTILLDNITSQAVAIANGGVVTERTGERVFIWIDTKK
ncbi:hypothetical protein PZH36_09495 [Ruminococcus bromii]|uniref:hypothetical protein n=1 Tax=Ruminococcus bromii TaxID=40518 RepID=UPI00292D4C80|nr:hypothetical protein [Ruminococcus bromii]MDE8727340.1 hypothetical protein [Ruminococcus bromii]